MYNLNPQDVARERVNEAEPYDENHERITRTEAELERTEDPVSGTRPETEPVEPEADEQAGEGS